MPVSRSGVIFVEYTVPNGASNRRPPAFNPVAAFPGSVWQPQPPPAAANTYFRIAVRSLGVMEASLLGKTSHRLSREI
jgi:hypothetical protein